jgi:hypothetical protein
VEKIGAKAIRRRGAKAARGAKVIKRRSIKSTPNKI